MQMSLYIEKSQRLNQKTVGSKVAGYKINIQKSAAFLYTKDETSEKENYPIYNSIKNNTWNKLTKEVKDLYNENDKTLLKETEHMNKWKDTCVHGLEELISLKGPRYPKQSPSRYQWHSSQKWKQS